MALKAMIESLDSVPEGVRGEYKEHEGKFYLDIEGLDSHHGVGALKRAKDYEKENARTARLEAARIQGELDTATNELTELRAKGVPKGDVDKLEKSYKDQLAKREGELNQQITALTASLERQMLDTQSMTLANELAAKPEYVELLMPHIRGRMSLETGENGEHVVRILDKDGKPSASNLDDLKKELLGNKSFAAILTGSKAVGGGATGNNGNGGGASKKLSEMNEAERVNFSKTDPEGFRKAVAEAQAPRY